MTEVQTSAREHADEAFAFPLSFAQQRLWFLHRLEPESSAYNVPLVLRMLGHLEPDALEAALGSLVERHEALRTTFHEEGGQPFQVIHPHGHELHIVDLSGLPEATRTREAERFIVDESNQPFTLDEGPLFRTTLVKLGDDEHLLAITVHHIVADAWSLGVLRRDLAAFYRAELENRAPSLPPLPIQYGDFAMWQRELLETERLEVQRDYWKTHLEGAPTLLELPADRPRPRVQTDAGGHVRARFEPLLSDRLKALGREQEATLFMVLLSAFGVLLSRYSGQQDLVVGTPIANRTQAELENLIGFFANTLALRLDLSGNPTFRELLARARETVLDAYGNQDFPFEQLVSELKPERSRSHSPLFQVLFQLQTPLHHGEAELPGLNLENVSFERGRAKFDLGLFMSTSEQGLDVSFEYSSDLFDPETVERMLGHLRTLLTAFANDPDQLVENAPLLDEEEVATLDSWNATAVDFGDTQRCVHELFEARARAAPSAPAAEFDGASVTYRELNERANRLARRLREVGVERDTCVAISLGRSFELLVAVLGVLKAGGAYCPLDPAYPAGRLELMLEQSEAMVVLTDSAVAERLPKSSAPVLRIDEEEGRLAGYPSDDLELVSDSQSLAYVLFTSGSTGMPKGVAMLHGPLVNLLAWQRGELGTRPVRTLQFASLSFDVAFQELFSTWSVGGTLILVDEERRRDSEVLLRLVDSKGVERLFVPFVALQHLAEAALHLGVFPERLRDVVTAGEALHASPAIRAFFARIPGSNLHNHYGPTESHVVTAHTLVGAPADWPARPPIGKPVANARIYILDRHQNRVPVGITGELYIGGPVLARGYINRPDLTAERFLPDPFTADPGRMYRTGDRARYLPGGDIDFLGRADDQVKIRGYRVEPGEVEAVLRGHPQLRDAVVVARDERGEDRRLIAYVVAENDAPTAVELREFLGRRLPDFMIPSAFVALDALPLGPTGKVNRQALPEPNRRDGDVGEIVLPRDELERRLVEIWQRSLETDEPIGVRDDFFALGGHSLLGVRVVAMIEEVLGVKLPLTSLFEASTVEGMAERVRALADGDDDWPTLVRLRSGASRPPLFLLHGRDGELLHYRDLVFSIDPDQPVYGIQPIGLDGRGEPSLSVPEMAEHYVRELRSFLPEGPYLLVGYCLSGVLAYEVAHQLSVHGSRPAFVGLIDAGPYGINRPTRAELERRKFADFRRRNLRGKVQWVATRARGLAFKVRLKARFLLYDVFARTGRSLPTSLRNVESALVKALSSYTSPESQVSITLFRAATDAGEDLERPTAWKRLAGEIEIRPIVAEGIRHDNIMRDPYASLLAAQIAECVLRALSQTKAQANGGPEE